MATRKPLRSSHRSRTDTHSIRATRHHAAARARARRRFKKQMAKTKRTGTGATTLIITTMLKMTRGRTLLEGSREPVDARLVERKVGELRRLVPHYCGHDDESVGLEGLLRVAADYVMWLEMQVKVMKIMLSVFSPKDM